MTGERTVALVDQALADHFGHRPVRASVSFVGVAPIEILRFEPIPGERAYLTLGMSREPMTSAAESVQSVHGPRAELMLHVQDPTDEFSDVWRQLAVLAAAPAVEGVVYAAGMTVDLGQPLVTGSACTGVVVSDSAIAPIETDDGLVQILLANPATQNELAWARVRGSAPLVERWAERGTPLRDLTRAQVALD